jgi:hypothetical protein
MTKQLWWGYRHVDGGVQAKRYFSPEDTREAEESPFVVQVIYPFPAENRDEALRLVEEHTK